MAELDADSPVTIVTGDFNAIDIKADDIVYEGAMVSVDASGNGEPLVNDHIFLGHAIEKVDNADGGVGAKSIRLRSGKYRLVCEVEENIGVADVGKPVYAIDDNNAYLTLTIGAGTETSYVGRVSRFISTKKIEVEFETLQPVNTV